jgi:transposase-like protein
MQPAEAILIRYIRSLRPQGAAEPMGDPRSDHGRSARSFKRWPSTGKTWGVKYDKAVECSTKDRDALLAFYDLPAEHWKHLRTTNVIESSLATVRHRRVPPRDICRTRPRSP